MTEATRIVLDGELTIYRAAELREFLLGELSRTFDPVTIDLSNVTELDSAGVQLLLAADAAARAAGRTVELHGPSEAVRDVFALLNLGPLFADGASRRAASAQTIGVAR
jgi:anti-anti-sigma factor